MKSLALPARFGSSVETKKRTPRAPIVVMVLGAALMLGHGFAQDYATALASPDGLYIPNARHVVPEGTPPGNYSHTFRIYNARPWSVGVKAHADCGCTGISWKETRLLPMTWRTLSVSLDNKKSNQSSSKNVVFQFSNSGRTSLVATIRDSNQ